ncbi:hypothetical protein [uncultured Eudoraea sp.]|uniref:hypothetical protein n=1 Tax=uncultured Eudoraea sp. TaxID=1035614 RepID=UPI002637D971|nr:hypothetical protein [uncultured Eudoraea sp.]
MKPEFLLSFVFMTATLFASAKCDNTYSSASYALNHTKKSISSKNFDHQKYYAYKALEALEKVKNQIEVCGCDKAMDPILDGIENLEKASDPKDFEMGRYYTKKAFSDIQTLISQLDIYTQGIEQTFDSSNFSIDQDSSEEKALLSELAAIKSQKIKLAVEQARLLERQKAIEKQINRTGS